MRSIEICRCFFVERERVDVRELVVEPVEPPRLRTHDHVAELHVEGRHAGIEDLAGQLADGLAIGGAERSERIDLALLAQVLVEISPAGAVGVEDRCSVLGNDLLQGLTVDVVEEEDALAEVDVPEARHAFDLSQADERRGLVEEGQLELAREIMTHREAPPAAPVETLLDEELALSQHDAQGIAQPGNPLLSLVEDDDVGRVLGERIPVLIDLGEDAVAGAELFHARDLEGPQGVGRRRRERGHGLPRHRRVGLGTDRGEPCEDGRSTHAPERFNPLGGHGLCSGSHAPRGHLLAGVELRSNPSRGPL